MRVSEEIIKKLPCYKLNEDLSKSVSFGRDIEIKEGVVSWYSDSIVMPEGYRWKLSAAYLHKGESLLIVKYYDIVADESEVIDFMRRATIRLKGRLNP